MDMDAARQKTYILQSYFLKTTAAVRAICDLTIYLCAIIYINKTDALCFDENGNKPFFVIYAFEWISKLQIKIF